MLFHNLPLNAAKVVFGIAELNALSLCSRTENFLAFVLFVKNYYEPFPGLVSNSIVTVGVNIFSHFFIVQFHCVHKQ
jgi:hypothetical protein